MPYLGLIVCPRAEFHVAVLIIKWIPGYINLASRHEYPRWNVSAEAVTHDQDIRWVGTQKQLVSTGMKVNEALRRLRFSVIHKQVRVTNYNRIL